MAQISVLAASQAQTSLKSHMLKADRPVDTPTKMYFPDTARQLALSVTYQKREKMRVPNCLPTAGYISHANDIFLVFHQKMLIYSTRETFRYILSPQEQGRVSSLSWRLVSVRNEKVLSHLSPSHKQKGLSRPRTQEH